ncbi:MAG: hypothetical protein ACPGXZ_06635 [Saprospiraceae bacterium]
MSMHDDIIHNQQVVSRGNPNVMKSLSVWRDGDYWLQVEAMYLEAKEHDRQAKEREQKLKANRRK